MKQKFKSYDRMTISLDKKEKEKITEAAGSRGISDYVRAIVLGYIDHHGELKKKGGRGGARSLRKTIQDRLEGEE
jgi:hypothetical protein